MPKLLGKIVLFILLVHVTDVTLAWFLKCGLHGQYGINRPVDVVFIGNSRVEAGIDPDIVSQRLKVPASRFTFGGSSTSDRLEMIKYWLSENTSPVKCLVYGVDQYSFRNARFKGGEDAYRHFYPFLDNPDLADYVKKNSSSRVEYYRKKLIKLERFNNQDKSLSMGYYFNRKEAYDYGVVNLKNRDAVMYNLGDYTTSIDSDGVAVFDETLNYLSQKKIPVVLLYFSTTDVLNDMNGPRYHESLILLRKFAEKYRNNVRLCEVLAPLSSRYDLFSDYSHFNRKGQVLASQLVADYLADNIICNHE